VTINVTVGARPTVGVSPTSDSSVDVTTPPDHTVDVSPVSSAPVTVAPTSAQSINVSPGIPGGVGVFFPANLPFFNVWDYGAVGDGTTDDTAAIQAALNAAYAAQGGVVVAPASVYKITDEVAVPKSVDLIGMASGSVSDAPTGTVFLCAHADAQIRFGDIGDRNPGRNSGGFLIDGDDIATNPLYIGYASRRTFSQIRVTAASGDGIVIAGAQNSEFYEIFSGNCGGHGFLLDHGAGGNSFFGCSTNRAGGNGGAGVTFQRTNVGTPTGAYSSPANNQFYGCVIERPAAAADAVVWHKDGRRNRFTDCVIAGGEQTVELTGPMVLVEDGSQPATLVLVNPQITGPHLTASGDPSDEWANSAATAIGIETSSIGRGVQIVGAAEFRNLASAFKLSHTAAEIDLDYFRTVNVTNFLDATSSGSANALIRHRMRGPIHQTRAATSDPVLLAQVSGESGNRLQLLVEGLRLGTSGGTIDVAFERAGVNRARIIGAVELPNRSSTPSAQTGAGVLYTATSGSDQHLFVRFANGTIKSLADDT
jgi:hypothetical protein